MYTQTTNFPFHLIQSHRLWWVFILPGEEKNPKPQNQTMPPKTHHNPEGKVSFRDTLIASSRRYRLKLKNWISTSSTYVPFTSFLEMVEDFQSIHHAGGLLTFKISRENDKVWQVLKRWSLPRTIESFRQQIVPPAPPPTPPGIFSLHYSLGSTKGLNLYSEENFLCSQSCTQESNIQLVFVFRL